MRRLSKKLLVPLLGVAALTLSACGGASSAENPADSSDGDVQATPPYIYAIDDDPRGLNAQFVGAPMTSMFSAQMLEPLIFMSSTFELSPGLAHEWEPTADGVHLTPQRR